MVAEVLKRRLADLRAATSINDLLAGRPRLLEGSERDEMVVDLRKTHRLVFCANHHPKNPLARSGNVDWPKVSRIKILRIESDSDNV
jgi:hypothetical protein